MRLGAKRSHTYNVNADGFTPLDLAVMTTNAAMVQLLQSHGAADSPKFASPEVREDHLQNLVQEAGRCVEDLSSCVLQAATNGSLSAALLKEKERQLSLWQRRHQLLKRMKTGFDHLRPPDPPSSVQLEVVGTRCLKVKFSAPDSACEEDSVVTKYKVEWSSRPDFSPLCGRTDVCDVRRPELLLPDLVHGGAYYVRVAAANAKGDSAWRPAEPPAATPSCWRDVEGKLPRCSSRMGSLDDLFQQVISSRPGYASEIKDLSDGTPQQQRKQVRKSIKHLFTSAPKFQKNMKRGVYLACLLYHEDKIIVTAEDTLPIMEVDETYPSPLHTDFHWLMKVSCTWDDVKTLRQDMEKSHSSSSVHFRSKLLQTSEQMQAALGLQDLGQPHHSVLRDSAGTAVLCCVRRLPDTKALNTLSVRWMPQQKLATRRQRATGDVQDDVNDMLVDAMQELISYSQSSCKPLSRGLYVGYMKLQSSVDAIRLLAPLSHPNVLPHAKIRDNQHVSCEEWQWFKSLSSGTSLPRGPTEVQMKFQKALSLATKQLLSQLDIPENLADCHRLYDAEVVELSSDVSFILVLPPVDGVCSAPGQCEEVTSRSDCLPLPIQVFEMIHMTTYQPSFISRYSRLSSILEMDHMLAQHAHREAFSASEVQEARDRLGQLQEFQARADGAWRAARWIMDVLAFARDKQANGLPLKDVWTNGPVTPPEEKRPQRQTCSPSAALRLRQSCVGQRTPLRRCSSASRLQPGRTPPHYLGPDAKCHSAERLADLQSVHSSSPTSSSSEIEDEGDPTPDPPSHVLRVYADYETGLPSGYSVLLHVTPLTTARDVVACTVRQLNTAARVKGRTGPLYDEGQFAGFCLVAGRRRLADDFRPARLASQRGWLKGKLSVRRKSGLIEEDAE